MSRLRIFLLLLAIAIVALAALLYRRNTRPPQIAFAKVVRERLVSTLTTNGKVEPYQWWPVRAARPGSVESVPVQRGDRVATGAPIVTLDTRDARAAVAAAEAAVTQARAQLATIEQGGSAAARVEIENALTRARLDLETAQREFETLERLAKREAATRQQVTDARTQVQQLEAQIAALERKRAALVDRPDVVAAQAHLQEAQAQLDQARTRVAASRITAPAAGIVYELAVRPGAYVNAGDLVASVGNLDRLRVRVYVDEPELGRVRVGMPVVITWDALPGREWKGEVESMPTQVVALGTRQVGEVIVTIANEGLDLLPGTNVNAEIQTQVVENALTIPKEAVRRDGLFVLRDGRVRWTRVKLGPSSLTRTAVLEGLSEGDMVALPTEQPLGDGERVIVTPR